MKFDHIINSTIGDWLCLPEIAFAVFGRSNKARALKVLAKKGEWIWETSSSLKDDAQIILTAMKTYPGAFACASERLRDDIDFVIEALSINSHVARFASQRLQDMMANPKSENLKYQASHHDITDDYFSGWRGRNDDGMPNNFLICKTHVYKDNIFSHEEPEFTNQTFAVGQCYAIGTGGLCVSKEFVEPAELIALKRARKNINHNKAKENLIKLQSYFDGLKCSYSLHMFDDQYASSRRIELALFQIDCDFTGGRLEFVLGKDNAIDEARLLKFLLSSVDHSFVVSEWEPINGLSFRFAPCTSFIDKAKSHVTEVFLLTSLVRNIETRKEKEWLAKQIPEKAQPIKTTRSNKI